MDIALSPFCNITLQFYSGAYPRGVFLHKVTNLPIKTMTSILPPPAPSYAASPIKPQGLCAKCQPPSTRFTDDTSSEGDDEAADKEEGNEDVDSEGDDEDTDSEGEDADNGEGSCHQTRQAKHDIIENSQTSQVDYDILTSTPDCHNSSLGMEISQNRMSTRDELSENLPVISTTSKRKHSPTSATLFESSASSCKRPKLSLQLPSRKKDRLCKVATEGNTHKGTLPLKHRIIKGAGFRVARLRDNQSKIWTWCDDCQHWRRFGTQRAIKMRFIDCEVDFVVGDISFSEAQWAGIEETQVAFGCDECDEEHGDLSDRSVKLKYFDGLWIGRVSGKPVFSGDDLKSFLYEDTYRRGTVYVLDV